MGCGLRVAGCWLRVAGCRLWVVGWVILKLVSQELPYVESRDLYGIWKCRLLVVGCRL